ncbi:hypothetical protein BSKO_02537 [Bryopsis sp. KO-2023]|nr:hypothetical protein BSKO_02537 [Bryopsis sp. KO-2023]
MQIMEIRHGVLGGFPHKEIMILFYVQIFPFLNYLFSFSLGVQPGHKCIQPYLESNAFFLLLYFLLLQFSFPLCYYYSFNFFPNFCFIFFLTISGRPRSSAHLGKKFSVLHLFFFLLI